MARNFSQMIAAIRNSDDALRAAVCECSAYILTQYHRNNRKVDGGNVNLRDTFLAALPDWLRKEASKWPLQTGKREPQMSDACADMRAGSFVAMAFAAQETKREIAKQQREARKAAQTASKPQGDATPQPDEQTAQGADSAPAIPMLTSALIDARGELMELNAEELDAAIRAVMTVRTVSLRVAA